MTLHCGDCLDVMRTMPDNSVDLVLTSPPYDNLRTYNDTLSDWTEEKWQGVLREIYRLIKDGGVCVWIVADATVNGSETGTSFRQALYAKECGFRLHDTMIWNKGGFTATGSLRVRYGSVFEYMFVFSKGSPSYFNPLRDRKNVSFGRKKHGTIRTRDGSIKSVSSKGRIFNEYGQRFNVWEQSNTGRAGTVHPATFPVKLAEDHVKSWTRPDAVVLDPFMGSGTTGIACANLGRQFIGIEREPEYFRIAEARINHTPKQMEMVR